MRIRFLLSFLVSTMVGLSVQASTLNIDESIGSPTEDYENGLSITNGNVGTIAGAGISVFTGRLDGRCVSEFGFVGCNSVFGEDSQDSFAFSIAPGLELFDVTFGSEGDGPDGLSFAFTLYEVVPGQVNLFDVATSAEPPFSIGALSFDPRGPGTYHLVITGNGGSNTELGEYFVGWGIQLQTREIPPVPAPAGLPMLVAGLGMLGVLRRRKA